MAGLSEVLSLESRVLWSVAITTPGLTALGNLDGDRLADEVVVHASPLASPIPSVSVDLGSGRGNGIFVRTDTTILTGFTAKAVTIGDVNGDGRADIVLLGQGLPTPTGAVRNEVIVLAGNGRGGFVRIASTATGSQGVVAREYGLPRLSSATGVAVGDFDGSSATAIAVLGQANVPTAAGATTTTSVAAVDVLWQAGASPLLPTASTDTLVVLNGNPNVNALFAGDLDRDRRVDLVAALASGTLPPPTSEVAIRPDLAIVRFPKGHNAQVSVGVNPFDTLVPPPAADGTISAQVKTVGLAPLNRGGPLDLVGLRGDSVVYAPYNLATPLATFGTAQIAKSINAPAGLGAASVYVGDIDGDGLPDLLAQTSGGAYLGRNTPALSSIAVGPVTFSWSPVILPPTLSPALGLPAIR